MNKILKTFAVVLFMMNSQYFMAQQTIQDQKAYEMELQRAENEARKTSVENHKKLDDRISELQKQQKEIEKQRKEVESKKKALVKSEDNLKSTKEKINKLELANQKIENKITTSTISDEEIQKQRLKTKENEVRINANNAAKRA